MDRRMILVLPGRRQQFICFSCREKIYYLFFVFIRKHKILLHERKKTKSQRNRNIGGGPRKETKLRKTEKGEQTKKGHATGTSRVGSEKEKKKSPNENTNSGKKTERAVDTERKQRREKQ